MINIAVIAECGIYRDALTAVLQREGFTVHAFAPHALPEADDQSTGEATEVLFICPVDRGEQLWALLDRLRRWAPQAKCVYVARPGGQALPAGAVMRQLDGLLTAEVGIAGLATALRDIQKGRRIYEASLISDQTEKESAVAVNKLTARERDVLHHIAEGFRSRAIAQKLQVSEKTVATYRMRLSQKLGIREPNELVRYAREYLVATHSA